MKFENKILIFTYNLIVIVLTFILFSFVFNIVINRIIKYNNQNENTRIFYLEIFVAWLILILLTFYLKHNISSYSKKKLTEIAKSNGEIDDYDTLYSKIDELEKFDIIIIVGFIVVFVGSYQHSWKEKLSLFNEDLGIMAEAI
jgi:uncharacterized membrane protein